MWRVQTFLTIEINKRRIDWPRLSNCCMASAVLRSSVTIHAVEPCSCLNILLGFTMSRVYSPRALQAIVSPWACSRQGLHASLLPPFGARLGQDILQEIVPDRWELKNNSTIRVRNAVCCVLSERWFVVDASLRRRGAAELRGLGVTPPPPGSSSGATKGWSVVCVQLHPMRCRATPAPVQALRPGSEAGLPDFLKDADIRLVHTPGCSVEAGKACSHPILPVVTCDASYL